MSKVLIHIYNIIWLDGILHYLCLSQCAEVSKFFLVVGTQSCACPDGQAFSSHIKTPRWPTSKIFNFHFGSNCFSLQSDLHCNIAANFSLSVHPAFVKVFMVGLSAMITCESFCLLALTQFFTLASPLAPHRLIYAKTTCSN